MSEPDPIPPALARARKLLRSYPSTGAGMADIERHIAAALDAEQQRFTAERARAEASEAHALALEQRITSGADHARAEAAEQSLREHIAVTGAALKRAEAAEGKLAFADSHMRTEMCRAMQAEKCARKLETDLGTARRERDEAQHNARVLASAVGPMSTPEVIQAYNAAIGYPEQATPDTTAICSKRCEHGSECLDLAGHVPADRHETQHGCVFFDPRSAAAS